MYYTTLMLYYHCCCSHSCCSSIYLFIIISTPPFYMLLVQFVFILLLLFVISLMIFPSPKLKKLTDENRIWFSFFFKSNLIVKMQKILFQRTSPFFCSLKNDLRYLWSYCTVFMGLFCDSYS